MWTLGEHGIELEHSVRGADTKGCHGGWPAQARQLTAADYQTFDYILAMDRQNLSDIMHKKPKASKAHIALFGSFARTKTDQVIKDPYYGSDNSGFDRSYEQCLIFTEGLIQHIQENHNAWLE